MDTPGDLYWAKRLHITLPEGPGARWRTEPYWNKYVSEGMVEYRLTVAIGSDVVCLCPDGGTNLEPVPIEPRMTWDEAVAFLSRCAVAPPVRYNGTPYNATSISFALVPASEPWHKWTGYDPADVGAP